MQKHLNRNKDKYNPYTLDIDEETNTYIVEFKDTKNIIHRVEVSEKVYEAFDRFELEDISQIHKIKKYIERNEVYEEIASEENCTKRAVKFSIDIAIEKISKKFNF